MRVILLDYSKPEARYDWSELEDVYAINVVSIPPSWEVADSVDEKFHNFLTEKVASQEFDLIFIPVSVTNAYSSYTGMRLGMHLRLTNSASLSLKRRLVPIIFMGFEPELQVFRQSDYAQFLLTPSVFYIQHTIKAVKYVLENIPSIASIDEKDFIESIPLYPIHPEPHLESSHSLANEWGAFELDRLTVNYLKDKPNNLDFNLYIKWLECQFRLDRKGILKEGLELPSVISGKKILFIDDEWDKRWNEVLIGIFAKAKEFKCLKLPKGLEREKIIYLAEAELRSTDWDLILLDLRLSEDDHDGRTSDFTGQKILEFIKGEIREIEEENESKEMKKVWRVVRQGHNPTLPVIMFTASTKARIIDILYEKGADGHFIKHSPSDSRTPDKVEESVQAFLNTIKNCLDKGVLLQPYWKRIQEIKKNNLIKGNERTVNGQETKFEERINERLTMFVGLLKKAYEQTDFDRNMFFYDQYEAAYLTLWSCLNEISEYFFKKTSDSGESVWSITNHGVDLIFLCKVGHDSFCKFDISTPALSVRDRVPADIAKVVDRKLKVDYHNSLQIQISFLIHKLIALRSSFDEFYFKDKGKIYDPSSSLGKNQCQQEWQERRGEILIILNKSNRKRNELNLTHASDSETEYIETVRNSAVKVSSEETENLFRVILFLTTGNFPNIL